MDETKIKTYHENGKIESEYYRINGKRHRTDGPAIIYYYENGKIEYENYYVNDKLHRTDGPAVINYYENGKIESEKYYINNKTATKEQIEEIKFNKELEEVLG